MKAKKLLWGIGGLVVILIGVMAILLSIFFRTSNNRDNISQANQEEMVGLALEWGRLAPFPSNIENFSIQTEGNAFTRGFRASFASTNNEIEKWVGASPGLADATVETMGDGKQKYVIVPGGGANYAEVIIDFATNTVQIYVSWG